MDRPWPVTLASGAVRDVKTLQQSLSDNEAQQQICGRIMDGSSLSTVADGASSLYRRRRSRADVYLRVGELPYMGDYMVHFIRLWNKTPLGRQFMLSNLRMFRRN